MKMEKLEVDNGKLCGTWKPFTIFIVVLLIATQFLIILNMRNSYMDSKEKTKSDTAVYENPNVKLKPLRLDKARFEIEVVKPHKVMRTKFHDHPDMIIKKLSKILEKERNR